MRRGLLTRRKTGDAGTFGTLLLDDGTLYHTGELPWRDNDCGNSCIPPGTYSAFIFDSPKHGRVYLLRDVPGRSMVEIHAANWMGDREAGLKCELEGCIALGMGQGMVAGQEGILASRLALKDFMLNLNGEELELTVVESYERSAT